jgi:hypothetical protein
MYRDEIHWVIEECFFCKITRLHFLSEIRIVTSPSPAYSRCPTLSHNLIHGTFLLAQGMKDYWNHNLNTDAIGRINQSEHAQITPLPNSLNNKHHCI